MNAKVSTAVSRLVRIQRLIESGGAFSAADQGGSGHEDTDGSFRHFDIKKSEITTKPFLGFTRNKIKVFFVAEVWLQNPNIGANNKNLVIHVFGERFMSAMTDIANKISEELQIDVHVRLEKNDEWDVSPEPWWIPAPAL